MRLKTVIVAFLAGFCLFATSGAQMTAPTARIISKLPCVPVENLAASADGNWLWLACEVVDPAWQKQHPDVPANADVTQSRVFAMRLPDGPWQPLTESRGDVTLSAASSGSRVLVESWQDDEGRCEVYDGATRAIGPIAKCSQPAALSLDGSRLYYNAGMTAHSDGFNQLGIAGSSAKPMVQPLKHVADSDIAVRPGDGHLLLSAPEYDEKSRSLIGDQYEYDAEGRFVSHRPRQPVGAFSRDGHYVASSQSAHGPVPWGIFDVQSGKKLQSYEFTGDNDDEYWFRGWNPAREKVFLASQGSSEHGVVLVRAFDMERNEFVASYQADREAMTWSADGKEVFYILKDSVVSKPVP
jgi:WD40 repeat protein